MRRFFSGFDWALVLALLLLIILGSVTIYSLIPGLLIQQVFYLFLGLAAFFLFRQIDFRIFEKVSKLFYIFAVLFLFTPLVFGQLTRGAFRWIQIGPFTVQPSELVKPFLIIFFASLFSAKEKLTPKEIFLALLLIAPPFFLIFFQPDLGSSLVVFFSWLGILVGAGLSFPIIFSALGLIGLFLPLAWKFLLKDYQQERIFSFLRPISDPLGAGYNLIQATVAVGAGQLLGRGLGRGTQSHLKFLPERHTDFIFASLAEDFGFFGVAILILAFAVLLWRILRISQQSESFFGRLICVGVFTLLFSQIFINIGMNLALLPITGITLPLVSYGGSSFIATMISLGVVENISSLKKREKGTIIGAYG